MSARDDIRECIASALVAAMRERTGVALNDESAQAYADVMLEALAAAPCFRERIVRAAWSVSGCCDECIEDVLADPTHERMREADAILTALTLAGVTE